MISASSTMGSTAGSTIDPREAAHFGRMAADWWNPAGSSAMLHKLNPPRLRYIRGQIDAHWGSDPACFAPLAGRTILDVGCGGGLLCEPLARLGATVTGIDATERNIKIAQLHATQSGVSVDYRATTSEALAAEGQKYDIVLNMEVVEHVDNVPLFMKSCADLVAPGGLLLTATLNRTARALAFAVIGAEYVLGWLPKGTHD